MASIFTSHDQIESVEAMAFKPALIVVDMQNDFCPPHGSLAVSEGRDIVPLVNSLLESTVFALKVATQDYHPPDHVSFASNHPGPDNKPFESFIDMANHVGHRPDITMKQRLWPDHCIQGTPGADMLDEIDMTKIDLVIQKGMDKRVEMYSAFADSFGNLTAGAGGVSADLASILRGRAITHVYIVGLAGDYCVKDTAIDAAKAGFIPYVIEEGQRCVDPTAWEDVKSAFNKASVKVVSVNSDEARRVL